MYKNNVGRPLGICVSFCLAAATAQTCGAESTLGLADHATGGPGLVHSANKMIGLDIKNAQDEDLGSVTDIVLDADQSRIAYAIVSFGGFLGFGDKLFAVPWNALTMSGDTVILDIAMEKLEKAPGFDDDHLPNYADPIFHKRIFEFYGVKPYELRRNEAKTPAINTPLGQTPGADTDGGYDWNSWTSRGENMDWTRKLSELIGTNIQNRTGDTIAEIDDVIIDSRDSRVAFALVSYGQTLGLGGDTAAVPWNALTLDAEKEVYTINASVEDLAAGKIDAEDYKKLGDESYARPIFQAFGTEPYWVANNFVEPAQPTTP